MSACGLWGGQLSLTGDTAYVKSQHDAWGKAVKEIDP
jgi:hypothetical protein